MSGLQRGTQDYRVILHHFQTKVYNSTNYNPEQIRNSNPAWAQKYNPTAFAESLRHIVSSLYLAPPPPIPLNPSAPVQTTDTMMSGENHWNGPPPAEANQ